MSFAGHQSFHIRDGWLRKGMREIQKDPHIFTRPDAADVFGLGSVMVDALRFWLEATGLAYATIENRWRSLYLTPFGRLVRDHDEYLEDEVTLWLLHYHLVHDRDRATTWHWFFNYFARPRFTKDEAVYDLEGWAISYKENEKAPVRKTLDREIDVLLRTYVPGGHNQTPEDTLDSPLSALELINPEVSIAERRHRSDEPFVYRLSRPDPERISPLLVLYVLLRYQQERHAVDLMHHDADAVRANKRRMSLSDALTQPASAGRVFLLTPTTIIDVLNRLREVDRDLEVPPPQQATGLDEMLLPDVSAGEVLQLLFAHHEAESPEEVLV